MNTKAREVFDSFESSFEDKTIIPETLELYWLKKAVGRFSVEVDPLNFDEDSMEFDKKIPQYIIDTLGTFMRQSYQERETSKVNKQVSIVSKDVSIDGNGNGKVAARNELEYFKYQSNEMISNQVPTAYA